MKTHSPQIGRASFGAATRPAECQADAPALTVSRRLRRAVSRQPGRGRSRFGLTRGIVFGAGWCWIFGASLATAQLPEPAFQIDSAVYTGSPPVHARGELTVTLRQVEGTIPAGGLVVHLLVEPGAAFFAVDTGTVAMPAPMAAARIPVSFAAGPAPQTVTATASIVRQPATRGAGTVRVTLEAGTARVTGMNPFTADLPRPPNSAPVIVDDTLFEDGLEAVTGKAFSYTLAADGPEGVFWDPVDGEPLMVTVDFGAVPEDFWLRFDSATRTLRGTAPLDLLEQEDFDLHVFAVTATDPGGLAVSDFVFFQLDPLAFFSVALEEQAPETGRVAVVVSLAGGYAPDSIEVPWSITVDGGYRVDVAGQADALAATRADLVARVTAGDSVGTSYRTLLNLTPPQRRGAEDAADGSHAPMAGSDAGTTVTVNLSVPDSQAPTHQLAAATATLSLPRRNRPPRLEPIAGADLEVTAAGLDAAGLIVGDAAADGSFRHVDDDAADMEGFGAGGVIQGGFAASNQWLAGRTPPIGPIRGHYGTLHLFGDGRWEYRLEDRLPAVRNLALGDRRVDSIDFRIDDGADVLPVATRYSAIETIRVTVIGTNNPPRPAGRLADVAARAGWQELLVIPPTAFSDVDAGDRLTYTVTGLPDWLRFDGVATLAGIPSAADVTTTPQGVTVTATDLHGATATATFQVTVNLPDVLTVVRAIVPVTVEAGGMLDLDAAAYFAGAAAPTYRFESTPDASAWLSLDEASGQFRGMPAAGQEGNYQLTLVVADADGPHSLRVPLSVTVASPPRLSLVSAAELTVTEAGGVSNGSPGRPRVEGSLRFGLGGSDPIPLGEGNTVEMGLADRGQWFPAGGSGGVSFQYGTVVLAADGSWSYDLHNYQAGVQRLGVNGRATERFDLRVERAPAPGQAGRHSNVVTVAITIVGANDTPVARDDQATLSEDDGAVTGHVISGSDFDLDADDVVAVTRYAVGEDIGVMPMDAGQPVTGAYGTLLIMAGGGYRYEPHAGAQALVAAARELDEFVYEVSDGTGAADGVAAARLRITVTGANDPPMARDDQYPVSHREREVTGNVVTANDGDVDAGTTLVVRRLAAGIDIGIAPGAPGDGVAGTFGTLTMTADGAFRYVLNAAAAAIPDGRTETDWFSYEVDDQAGAANSLATARLSFPIRAGDMPPVGEREVGEDDGIVTGRVLAAGAVDGTGNALTVTRFAIGTTLGDKPALAGQDHAETTIGSLSMESDGRFLYRLLMGAHAIAADDSRTDTFTYEIAPAGGAGEQASTGSLVIRVTGANDPPLEDDGIDDQAVMAGRVFNLPIPATAFSEIDEGDRLTLTASGSDGAELPEWLDLARVGDAYRFEGMAEPSHVAASPYTLVVTATDLAGTTATAEFLLTVTEGNTAPTVAAQPPNRTVPALSLFRYAVPDTLFTDADGDSLTITVLPLPDWLRFDGDGKILSGTPMTRHIGESPLIVIVANDGRGGEARASFRLSVQRRNAVPMAVSGRLQVTAVAGVPFHMPLPANSFHDGDFDPLSYDAAADNGALPRWLSFAGGEFRGTPMATDITALPLLVSVTAEDGFGGRATWVFELTVAAATAYAAVLEQSGERLTLRLPYVELDLDLGAGTPPCVGLNLSAAGANLPWTLRLASGSLPSCLASGSYLQAPTIDAALLLDVPAARLDGTGNAAGNPPRCMGLQYQLTATGARLVAAEGRPCP